MKQKAVHEIGNKTVKLRKEKQDQMAMNHKAQEGSDETFDLCERGKLTEKQTGIRAFLPGKSLIGWENDDWLDDQFVMELQGITEQV